MLYFKTRAEARKFAKGKKKIVDMLGLEAKLTDVFKAACGTTKRWAVKIV